MLLIHVVAAAAFWRRSSGTPLIGPVVVALFSISLVAVAGRVPYRNRPGPRADRQAPAGVPAGPVPSALPAQQPAHRPLRLGLALRRPSRPGGWLRGALAIAVVIVWITHLHPQALGGRTSYLLVAGESMAPLLHVGDLAVVMRDDEYRVGDVVAYRVPSGHLASGQLVIHRIVAVDGSRFVLHGDNVDGPDLWQPTRTDIVGKLWILIPSGGRIALILRNPTVLPALLAAITVAVLVQRSRDNKRPVADPATV